MTRTLRVSLAAALVPQILGACAPAGTQPHDMSVASHQAAAENEEAQAVEHAQQHDPDAESVETTCTREGTERQACWSDMVNPTAEHEKMAQEHRELAAKHRAAAAELAAAEASACGGISETDRDMSPFAHRADILGVSELKETLRDEHGTETQRQIGASVVFKAVPGMTAEWLQRVVDCHLARNAALGHDVPEMAYCPLVPKGAAAKVKSVGDGFVVEVQGDSEASIREIVQRARKLAPGSKPGNLETWTE